MKKIFFLLLGFIAAVSAKAQVVEVYENGTLIHIYNNTPATKYTVKFKAPTNSETTIDGHDYVEIGGKKWATMNVGATTVAGSPETAYGDYYTWGETVTYYTKVDFNKTPETSISWKGTKIEGAHINNNKYKHNWCSYSGTDDNSFKEWSTTPYGTDGVLNEGWDVAHSSWGSSWRMPTKADFDNLVKACCGSTSGYSEPAPDNGTIFTGGVYYIKKAPTTVDGVTYNVPGILFVDQIDPSKRLFFPAAGNLQNEKRDGQGSLCTYWSSSKFSVSSSAYCAYYSLVKNTMGMKDNVRCFAFSIRPVSD